MRVEITKPNCSTAASNRTSKHRRQGSRVHPRRSVATTNYNPEFDVAVENSSFGTLHRAFKAEERDESWASAMENGLGLAIQKSQATQWTTIVDIECRTSICEVRGYMPDRMGNQEFDPGSLLTGDFGAGWWQGTCRRDIEHAHL